MAKAYICILLAGLEYLHAECKVAHTDLNLDNILMTLESESVLSDFIKEHTTEISMQYKTNPITGRTVYSCHDDLGSLNAKELGSMTPKIVDFDQATWLESGNPKLEAIGLHPIQPDHCCAPEEEGS